MPSILIGALFYAVLAAAVGFFSTQAQLDGQTGLSQALGCVACIVALSSGLVAVWHYTSTHSLTISAGEGVGLGALAGLGGAVIAGGIGLLLQALGVTPGPDEMLEVLRRQFADQGMSDAEIEQAMSFTGAFTNPVIGVAIGAVMGTIAGLIGGAIGAAIFKKGQPEDLSY